MSVFLMFLLVILAWAASYNNWYRKNKYDKLFSEFNELKNVLYNIKYDVTKASYSFDKESDLKAVINKTMSRIARLQKSGII